MIMELLPIGKANAISTRSLCSMTGLNVRELRSAVAAERMSGEIILSCNSGYFKPETREEVQECVRTLEARGKSTLCVLKSARRFLRDTAQEESGQIEIQELS